MTDTTEEHSALVGPITGEMGRRLIHAMGVAFPLAYLLGAPWWFIQSGLVAFVLVSGILEILRLQFGIQLEIYEHLTREYEQSNVAGYALYAIGMTIIAFLFAPRIAIPAMFMLAVGDPLSGIFAGDHPMPMKRPLVMAGMFLLCLLFAVPFLPLPAALAAALTATLADGVFLQVGSYVVDDNLSIPIGAAVAAWFVVLIL